MNSNFADLITVSLYANKIVTAGEGGAIVGKPNLIEKINKLKNQSQDPKRKFSHDEIGYNYRITNLQGAVFNAQWNRKAELLRARRRVFTSYQRELNNNGIAYSMNVGKDDSPWLMTIRLQNPNQDMQTITKLMMNSGIDTRPGFTAFSKMPYIAKKSKIGDLLVNSESLSQTLISLPTYPSLSNRQISDIVQALSEALQVD